MDLAIDYETKAQRLAIGTLVAILLAAMSLVLAGVVLWQTEKLAPSAAIAAGAVAFVVLSNWCEREARRAHNRGRQAYYVATGEDPCKCGQCAPLPDKVRGMRQEWLAEQQQSEGGGDGGL